MKGRNTRIAWTGAFAVCAGLGCASAQVRTAHDPNVPLSQYRTFALKRGQIINEGVVDKDDTLTRDRINQAVHEELTDKGLKATNLNPDLIVTFATAERSEQELMSYWGSSYTIGGTWGPGYAHDSARYLVAPYWATEEIHRKVLVIDLIDANTNKRVWRSIARADNKDFRKPENVEKAVDKALAKFPATS